MLKECKSQATNKVSGLQGSEELLADGKPKLQSSDNSGCLHVHSQLQTGNQTLLIFAYCITDRSLPFSECGSFAFKLLLMTAQSLNLGTKK